ncbi:MAG: S-adenosyl-l-methionine hydroxide adenosyltransferase family protein [Candidatus Hodarchaeota archaeon]
MKLNPKPIIVLLTDFGNDPYVGIMCGKILQINPHVNFVTLTNQIKNHDIRHAAFVLAKSFNNFPLQTIFLVVVDPGVGSPRQAIAAKKGEYYFIGPDNGVLSPILVENEDSYIFKIPILESISSTFHGRDIFAPAAGKLSLNYSLRELGSQCNLQTQLKFLWDPLISEGEVIFIDTFGNIITSIPSSINLELDRDYLVITNYIKRKMCFKKSYYEGSDVNPFLIVNSFGTIEIAVRNSKASDIVEINPGEKIRILPIN